MTDVHQIVSSESEDLILVDEEDREIGHLSKADAHDGSGVLHRAFSIFLFDAEGRLLLQQRAAGKRLWPGYWSNTCCSHPRRGESLTVATARRMREELNIGAALEFAYKFCYQADYGGAGAENELCHVYLGTSPRRILPNANEIAAVKFMAADELERALDTSAGDFTPWFKMEWRTLREQHAAQLQGYTGTRRSQPT